MTLLARRDGRFLQRAGERPAPPRNPHTSTTTQYVQLAVNSAMRSSSCDLDGARCCLLLLVRLQA